MYLSDEEYSNCFEKPKKKGKRKRSPSPPPKTKGGNKTPKGKAKKSRQDEEDEDDEMGDMGKTIFNLKILPLGGYLLNAYSFANLKFETYKIAYFLLDVIYRLLLE